MTRRKYKKQSSRKEQNKVLYLDVYIKRVHSDIDTRASEVVSKFMSGIDEHAISIEDDIKYVLLVNISDVLGNNHDNALNNAAAMKCINLGLKAFQEGLMPEEYKIPDIFTVISSIGPALTNIAGITSSFLECTGKNLTQGNNNEVFQYGLCCHIGASGNKKSGIAYDLGIYIGNICTKKQPVQNYAKAYEQIKQLPKNKYRTLLSEIVDKITEDAGILCGKPKNKKENFTKKIEEIDNELRPKLKLKRKKQIVDSESSEKISINKADVESEGKQEQKTELDVKDGIATVPLTVKFSTSENE